jgi:hypothetical protein
MVKWIDETSSYWFLSVNTTAWQARMHPPEPEFFIAGQMIHSKADG